MEIYLTPGGEVSCRPSGSQDTVADLLRAMEIFCSSHIDCAGCTHTCCAGLVVYADNVFARRLAALGAATDRDAAGLPARILCLHPGTRRWFLPANEAGRCRFLAADGRCIIYRDRPLVCRLHLCLKSEAGFARLKDELYHAYRHALACEMAGWTSTAANPLIGAADYDAPLGLIAAWTRTAQS